MLEELDSELYDYGALDLLDGRVKTGGGAKTYVIDAAEYQQPALLKQLGLTVRECSLATQNGQATCVPTEVASVVLTALGVKTMPEAISSTGCDSEKCAVSAGLAAARVGRQRCEAILTTYYKVDGPTDTKLLSNVNIDAVMRQYAVRFRDFYAYNFNMVDYAKYSFIDGEIVHQPDSLATVTYEDMNAMGKRCCGCIVNSDVYEGPGKHWMALFADWRGPEPTVEFFNSSGNAPAPEFANWMAKMHLAMGGRCFNVTAIRHQHTTTECGVYALFYVFCRLTGVPASQFETEPIPDQAMFEFRQHLFKGGAEFDYAAFRAKNKIDWESGHNAGQISTQDSARR
jgi:hypothetical protein